MVVGLRFVFVVLWYTLCMFACIDTKWFVYPSLSQTLLPSVVAILMVIICTAYHCLHKETFRWNRIQVFALVWIVYVLLHGLMIVSPEQYKQMYLVGHLLLLVGLIASLRSGLINRNHLVNGVLLIVGIHVLYLTLQRFGFMSSSNPYFELTGADENPNVTAIAISIGIPFILCRIKGEKKLWWYVVLLALCFVCLLALKCRTAYVGITCVFLFWLFGKFWQGNSKVRGNKLRWALLILISILGVFAFAKMYSWKKDSADGRLFIWQRCCEMITEKPLGMGYGLYEHSYNLYQAHFFETHENARLESELATASGSAYNDVLEHGVQGGVVGSLFFLLFLLMLIRIAIRSRNSLLSCVMMAILVMSLINSICYSITPWLLTVVISAMIGEEDNSIKSKKHSLLCQLAFVLFAVCFLGRNILMTKSQMMLNSYKSHHVEDVKLVKSLYPNIGTSEAYWRYLASCNEVMNDYRLASDCYDEALKYTSAPSLIYKSAMCKEKCGDIDKAIDRLNIACNMLPGKLSYKYSLMTMFLNLGDVNRAKEIAQRILVTPVKNASEKSLFIIDKAKEVVEQ